MVKKTIAVVIVATLFCAAIAQANDCDYRIANNQMVNVLAEIEKMYAEDTLFLARLTESQMKWEAFVEAHLQSRFPAENKIEYGSVYTL